RMAIHAHVGRLLVHQLASEVAAECIRLAEGISGPGAEKRADQLVRAAISIPSNIAEACGRGTLAEFRRFLVYARGSAQELRTQLGIARRVGPQQATQIKRMESRVALVIRMLSRLYENPPKTS
ncbi:MAG: four helix bundle protein, partial [Gammaproteobacteria bacterium]